MWADALPSRPPQAKDELNETEEKRAAAVAQLRMMMSKADGGDELSKGVLETFGNRPDKELVRFIRARKYDTERAYELMKGESGPKIKLRTSLVLVWFRVERPPSALLFHFFFCFSCCISAAYS